MYFILLLLFILTLAIVLTLVIERAARIKPVSSLDIFAHKVNGTITYNWKGVTISGVLDGEPISVIFHPKRRKYLLFPQAPSLGIGVYKQTSGRFCIAQRSDSNSHFPRDLRAQEVKTGNALFDKELVICSPDSSFVKSNFKDGEKRQAIRRIFTLGARWILFDGQTMSAVWEPFDPKEEIDESAIKDALARLLVLSKNIQPANEHGPEAGGDIYVFLVATVAIFLTTIVLSVFLLYLM